MRLSTTTLQRRRTGIFWGESLKRSQKETRKPQGSLVHLSYDVRWLISDKDWGERHRMKCGSDGESSEYNLCGKMLFLNIWSLVFCHISRYLTPIYVSDECVCFCMATALRACFSVRACQLCQCKALFSDCWQDCWSQMPFTWFSALSWLLIRYFWRAVEEQEKPKPGQFMVILIQNTILQYYFTLRENARCHQTDIPQQARVNYMLFNKG